MDYEKKLKKVNSDLDSAKKEVNKLLTKNEVDKELSLKIHGRQIFTKDSSRA